MTTTCEPLASTEFNLGPLDQIPAGEGREFHILGRQIAVFHARSGAVYATQALCPHREGSLIDGLMGASTLICPMHAWKFDLSTGEHLSGECPLTTYAVRLDETGQILLKLGDTLPQDLRPME